MRRATAAHAPVGRDTGTGRRRSSVVASALVAGALVATPGCMVGPEFVQPTAPVEPAWTQAVDASVVPEPPEDASWWTGFGDPVLSQLVLDAYAGNRDLRAAGLRVIQAQARRAISIGTLFPQSQNATASYARQRISANTGLATASGVGGATTITGSTGRARYFSQYQAGFDAAWELDLWGRFRRGIEASDEDLIASVADYDAVLVSLVAEVAATYTSIRTLEERLAIARDNVGVQEASLRIATVRYEAGGTTELDVAQATALLRDTEATIPQYAIQLRQAKDALAVLLGVPPSAIDARLATPGTIPAIPPSVLVGIPADLLRRRPDVLQAEHAAAAQSARIGVATADLLPSLQLVGTIGLSSTDAAHFFEGRSWAGQMGPSVSWPILDYGRIINNVRLQDAVFQELLTSYETTVLRAQQEVEDALAGYVLGVEQVQKLSDSVAAANRAVDLSVIQYREGATDYTRVLNSQQSKLREDDLLVTNRGAVARSVIALYKALGGGWQLRNGNDFVPEETTQAMRARTYWGGTLDPERRAADIEQAAADTAPDRPWWKPRWWWPRW